MDLKYENKFKVGDKIKALDFAPSQDTWFAGYISKIGYHNGAKGYFIEVTQCSYDNDPKTVEYSRLGEEGFVPMECFFTDRECDNRITSADNMMEVTKSTSNETMQVNEEMNVLTDPNPEKYLAYSLINRDRNYQQK